MSDLFSGRSGGGLAGGLPNGVKLAAIGLLVHQLMKHSRGEAGTASQGGGIGGLLGGLFGGGDAQPSGPATAARGGEQGQGGGIGDILGGLLGGGARSSGPAPGPWGHAAGQGGGLGGLGGLLAGGAGGGLLGGLGGLLESLRGQGLGQHVDSWVGHGPNQPVPAQHLEQGFDPQELDEVARRAGTDRGTLLQELSAMLPQVVDRMTPQGRLPQREEEVGGGLGGLLASLLGGDRQPGPGPR
ncbi:YidB family protein [Roseicella aquatilis]|uniref:DUF937 domain-containing protein n=1 Tax=Roseicella aquatilis TaxID=2527868 RepID=A0A4R4D414_9PROT|nr:YidB family protein [Roseicella aquatilis]TCZ54989.1 DUF937 domain-containing protein [Roseicella aquatilis]